MTYSSTGTKTKPIIDESGFQQLLAAAYVLQQHNDSLHSKDPRLDAAWILSQITETESAVREDGLGFSEAAHLISERLCKMTGAVSASICRVNGDEVDCIVESGVAAKTPGCSIAWDSAAANDRLKNGRQFQSLDAQADPRLDADLCQELGVRSLLAVPIQPFEELAALVEVRWGLPDALHECDVRTCRLMAGLLAETLQHEAASLEQATASQPEVKETVLAPIDSLNALSDLSEMFETPSEVHHEDLATECRVCGRVFADTEAFCGNCSMPRVASGAPTNDGLQSKWASMWFMQQAQDTQREDDAKGEPKAKVVGREVIWPPTVPLPAAQEGRLAVRELRTYSEPVREPEPQPLRSRESQVNEARNPQNAIKAGQQSATWAHIVEWARQGLALHLKISRRAIVAAGACLVAVLCVSVWLSLPSGQSPQLTWFESILVQLGLAEVPQHPAAEFAGTPEIRVWEDVHTALYYCPDSELYGKTPGGRFSTQRAAQQDQFEPATRIACQ